MRCGFPSQLLNSAVALWMAVCAAMTAIVWAGPAWAGQAAVHEVTGQAAITDEVSPERARRLALEDALYLAALQGGVAIDGFSAMDASTALNEEMVLRPTADILDYTIVEEKQVDKVSRVTIRAVTGMADPSTCEAGLKRYFTVFEPRVYVSPAAPAWAGRQADRLMQNVLKNLPERGNASYELATDIEFDAARRQRTDQLFDYRVLTEAPAIQLGDYALQFSLKVDAMTSDIEARLIQEESVHATLQVDVYTGQGFEPVFSAKTRKMAHIELDYFINTINQILQAPRPTFDAELAASFVDFVDNQLGLFLCQTLHAKVSLTRGRAIVPLGRRHGLAKSHLAVLNKPDAPFRVLRIENLTETEAVLSPLDPETDLSKIDGQHVRFLEAK
tara:strand:- start:517 stop:1683 length:1167 start_codon:yes stop_codon:yes gene_type:complete